ncbi:MAG: Gfo/Idh/MocA family oxidoreductase [bacterium]
MSTNLPDGPFAVGPRAFTRREFAAVAGVAGLAAAAAPVFAQEAVQPAGPKIKLGVVGCGQRGTFVSDLAKKHGGFELVAVADYFQDRADALGESHGVPAERRFTGLDGYTRMLGAKPDAVAVMSPPFFHPAHVAASVEAGCHVYVAKPVAVDVSGCLSIDASAKRATEKKLCLLVDFQTRAQPFYREAVRLVHEGAIGDLVFGEAFYHCGQGSRQAGEGAEGRLRDWLFDKALSGDIITEQNIHALDVMNWVHRHPPLHAAGTGGRKVRLDVGDCWDNFTLHYQYPDNVGMTFSSRQFAGHGTMPEGIGCRVFGTKGVLETSYGGTVMIRGLNFYRGGTTKQIYIEGVTNNIAAFFEAVRKGECANATVAPSVQSCLITIMGRKAAYTGQRVTWDEILKDTERLDPRLEGLKA